MVIFKPSKILLYKSIKKYPDVLYGITLDAGFGGLDRYSKIFPRITKRITLDIDKENKPDILASVEDVPLEKNSIDSIICTEVISYVTRPDNAIKEFSRILKEGGVLLLSDILMTETRNSHDYWRFTEYILKRMLENNGFKIIAMEKIGGFFAVIAQFKIRYLINRFNLYNNKILNYIFRPILNIYGRFMLCLDKLDKSETNNKYAIGYMIIARKK